MTGLENQNPVREDPAGKVPRFHKKVRRQHSDLNFGNEVSCHTIHFQNIGTQRLYVLTPVSRYNLVFLLMDNKITPHHRFIPSRLQL